MGAFISGAPSVPLPQLLQLPCQPLAVGRVEQTGPPIDSHGTGRAGAGAQAPGQDTHLDVGPRVVAVNERAACTQASNGRVADEQATGTRRRRCKRARRWPAAARALPSPESPLHTPSCRPFWPPVQIVLVDSRSLPPAISLYFLTHVLGELTCVQNQLAVVPYFLPMLLKGGQA